MCMYYDMKKARTVAPMFSDGGSSLALAPVGCAFWPMIARSPDGAALQGAHKLRVSSQWQALTGHINNSAKLTLLATKKYSL